VVPIPGATAFVAALSGSGLPSDQFLFAGFLPARASARRAKLEDFRATQATLIFYEAPHRIAATLRDAADISAIAKCGSARVDEMHEEFVRGGLNELAENFSARNKARGEIVLLIAGAQSAHETRQDRKQCLLRAPWRTSEHAGARRSQ